ncbi:MAG: hypothetical protein WD795_05840 [Woeseia sp.]
MPSDKREPHNRGLAAITGAPGAGRAQQLRTYYDFQISLIAAFLGEARLVRETLRDSRSRMLKQFYMAGLQRKGDEAPQHGALLLFQPAGWIHLAQLARICGEDLWSFQGSDRRGILLAMADEVIVKGKI